MIILYILLGIIALLFILLYCPVYVYFSFTESLVIKARFLFFSFTLFPKQTKKDTENIKEQLIVNLKDEKLKEESKYNKILDIIKEKGLIGFLKILKELLQIVLKSTEKIFDNIHIDSVKLSMIVVGNDAADTAIKYGKTYAFIGYAASVLLKNVNVNRCHINIFPGFNAKESKVNFTSDIHFIPISIIKIIISVLYKLIKSLSANEINIKIRKGAAK